MSNTTITAVLLFIVIAIVLIIKQSMPDTKYTPLKSESVILAFGDSLTFGYGVKKEFSYPSVLAKKTALRVINAGVSGEESAEGLSRLEKYLDKKPDLVILCHGGNDILRKHSSLELKNNPLKMVALIKQSGAEVLLVGVPDFSLFGFDTHSVYSEVADETGIVMEEGVLRHIELNRALKSDYIHPNEKGYEMMADKFIEVLKDNNML